jgi:transposase InsO family protein
MVSINISRNKNNYPSFFFYSIMDKLMSDFYEKNLITAKQLREANPGIHVLAILDFLSKQEGHQMHKHVKKSSLPFAPIVADAVNANWQMDLMDVSNNSHANEGVKFLLCIVDVFSRFAWVLPLKNKMAKTVNDTLEPLVKQYKVQNINIDKGSEFKGETLKMLKANNVKVWEAEAGEKTKQGIVERFNRTIRELIEKYLTINQTKNYIKELPSLVKNYNSSTHSGTNAIPAAVFSGKKKTDLKKILLREREFFENLHELQVGDSVRRMSNKGLFSKGATAKFSKTVYSIDGFEKNKVKLSDGKLVPLYVLQKVEEVQTKPDAQPLVEEPVKKKNLNRKEMKEITEAKAEVKRVLEKLPEKRKIKTTKH